MQTGMIDMKNQLFFGLAIAATGFGATAALSDELTEGPGANQTTAVNINTQLPQTCSFTTTPAAVVPITTTAGEKNIGDLGYTCNFTGQVSLVLDLPNGSKLFNPANGSDTVTYGLAWTLPPNPSTPSYQNFGPGAIPFGWPTASTPNIEHKGTLWVKLPADLTVAGTYTSVIRYTINP
jgi:hypothetical protein